MFYILEKSLGQGLFQSQWDNGTSPSETFSWNISSATAAATNTTTTNNNNLLLIASKKTD